MSKFRMKQCAVMLLTGIMTLGLFSGCGSKKSSGSGASQAVSGVKLLYIGTDKEDAYRKLLVDSVVAAAKDAGCDLTEAECGNNVEEQVKAAASAKKDGYQAIICRLTDGDTAPQIELAAAGLPIVYVNSEPVSRALSKNKYVYVASDESQAGSYQAEYVAKKLNKKELNIVILEGEKGHSGAIQRTKYVKNYLKDKGIKFNVVFMDYANWSDTEAEAAMKQFFKTKQSFDAVFCNNDTMALGAVKAMKEAGFDPAEIPVLGVDATKDGCQSIKDGDMQFTVYQNADGQGKKAVEIASLLGSGKKVDSVKGVTADGKDAWVPFEPVDASNVSDYMK